MKPLLTLTLLAAAPALADCPTGADLATGIRVLEADNTTHIYSDNGKGIVQVDITYDGGGVSRNLLAQGNHVLQLSNIENGRVIPDTIANTAYPTSAENLPIPTANDVWTVQTTVNAYGDIYAETQMQTWGDTFTLTIGTCSFEAIKGALKYVSDANTIDEGVYFIPALGISLLYSYGDLEMAPEVYSFTQIEAVR
jgi:hypothetical protein